MYNTFYIKKKKERKKEKEKEKENIYNVGRNRAGVKEPESGRREAWISSVSLLSLNCILLFRLVGLCQS